MCGIVGYIGNQQAVPILIDGLEKLEYRGYDSAGVSVFDGTKLQIRKRKGRLAALKELLEKDSPEGTVGIGHTRWATHGAPSDQNSHPHINQAGTISVVHNGIIENHMKIREWLSGKGYSFRSQTDTEVIAHLVDYYYKGNIMEAVSEAVKRLTGAYAICIVCKDEGDKIITVRKGCPLVIGVGEGENFIASDIPALLKYTRDVYFLEDDEFACITKDSVDIYDAYGVPVMRDTYHVEWEMEAAEKAGYQHFMLKEIHEEPKVLRDALHARLNEAGDLDLSEVGLDAEQAKKIRRVIISSCGTAYMQELDNELWKLGILAKTEHNEGAPAQHELAPIFTNTNTATDHNQLTMETMKKVAHKHGFICLLHEKPFEGINGSGKHNNWSLNTNTGINVFKPGKNPAENKMFLLFLCAVIKAVDLHQDLLRISVTSPGNDHRLGAHEAPPAIVSIFLGDELTDILESIKNGSEYRSHKAEMMATGVHVLPDFMKDTTDRNRTSPLAFTGNKFEFRMLGSSNSIAGPNITINTIVADVLDEFAEKLESAEDFDSAVTELMRETLLAHDRIIFNGNNYADEWIEEAERRGLLNLRTTVDALPHYLQQKNIDLFTKNGVFTRDELNSRFEIQLENYSKVLNIEALTMLEMSKRDIMPAVSAFIKQLTDGIMNKKSVGISLENDAEMKTAERCSKLLNILFDNTEILERYTTESVNYKKTLEKAQFFKDYIIPAMDNVRAIADELETLVGKKYWPFPTYGDILFYGE